MYFGQLETLYVTPWSVTTVSAGVRDAFLLLCSLERLFHLAGLILSEHFAFYLKGEVGNSGKR